MWPLLNKLQDKRRKNLETFKSVKFSGFLNLKFGLQVFLNLGFYNPLDSPALVHSTALGPTDGMVRLLGHIGSY